MLLDQRLEARLLNGERVAADRKWAEVVAAFAAGLPGLCLIRRFVGEGYRSPTIDAPVASVTVPTIEPVST